MDQLNSELRRANLNGTNPETFLSISSLPLGITIPTNPSTVLPLTLLSFSATPGSSGVSLQWVTTDEVNTEAFDVERSSDGRNFIKVASLPTQATSTSHTYTYEFTDRAIVTGRYFYRLKMRDIGGVFTYSKTVEVNYTINERQQSFVLFPNPVTGGELYLRPVRRMSGEATIQVIDAAGYVIARSVRNMSAGDLLIPVDSLTRGGYFVRIIDKSGAVIDQLRFVKQ